MGRVPSGCASFTSAPASMRASAALRSPAWMRLARDGFGACARIVEAPVITQMAMMRRFTVVSPEKYAHNGPSGLSALNDIAVHFVMVSPETFGCVVEEFVRIFPRSRKTLQNARLQHLLWTVAL